MIVNRIDILDDDAPLKEANRLVISKSDDGDVWVSVITYDNGSFNPSGTVRLRTTVGGGSHPELLKDLYSLIDRAMIEERKHRNGSIVVY